MSVLVGKKAPSFTAAAVLNGAEIVRDFSLDQYLDKNYVIFFFYPKDFSLVCPTELHAFQSKLEEFKSKGCEIVACSTDNENAHLGWLQMPKNQGGIQGITYPLVADTTKTISMNYGILAGEYDYDENGNTIATGPMIPYRGLFLINKKGMVVHQVINLATFGRNVDEAMRMLDAVIHNEAHGELCPANWEKGKEGFLASHKALSEYMTKN